MPSIMWCCIFNHWCKPVPYGNAVWIATTRGRHSHTTDHMMRAQQTGLHSLLRFYPRDTHRHTKVYFSEYCCRLKHLKLNKNICGFSLVWEEPTSFTFIDMSPPPLQLSPSIKSQPALCGSHPWLWVHRSDHQSLRRSVLTSFPLKQQQWLGQAHVVFFFFFFE